MRLPLTIFFAILLVMLVLSIIGYPRWGIEPFCCGR